MRQGKQVGWPLGWPVFRRALGCMPTSAAACTKLYFSRWKQARRQLTDAVDACQRTAHATAAQRTSHAKMPTLLRHMRAHAGAAHSPEGSKPHSLVRVPQRKLVLHMCTRRQLNGGSPHIAIVPCHVRRTGQLPGAQRVCAAHQHQLLTKVDLRHRWVQRRVMEAGKGRQRGRQLAACTQLNVRGRERPRVGRALRLKRWLTAV